MSKHVRVVLQEKRLFGDGPPHWQMGRGSRKRSHYTAEEVGEQANKLIGWLNKADEEQFPGAADLTARLESCHPRRRCGSGACPICARAYQRWMVTQLHSLFGNNPETINPEK